MPKFEALHDFESRSQGTVSKGDVLDVTVKLAEEINVFSNENYHTDFLKRVDEPKKDGKK